MDLVRLHIEALLFAARPSINRQEIRETISESFESDFSPDDIENYIQEIKIKYDSPESVVQVVEIAEGLQMLTKAQYHNTVIHYLKQEKAKKLSTSALETLSIIAYRQPVTKTSMEEIRGVNCDYAVNKLLEKELIEVVGRSDEIGKPILYGTSQKFLDYFGLKNEKDLPQLEEMQTELDKVGPVQE